MKQASLVNVNEVKALLNKISNNLHIASQTQEFISPGHDHVNYPYSTRFTSKQPILSDLNLLFRWAKEKDETETKRGAN